MTSRNSTSRAGIIALDTTAYSHLVRGDKDVAARLMTATLVVMPQPTVAELKGGYVFGSRQAENEANLARFLSSYKVQPVFPDTVTTEQYVAIYTHARRQARKLSHNDLWIAALAAQYNAELLSFDHDFDALLDYAGLRVQVFDAKS